MRLNRKCHNCSNGIVDGGFMKRIIKELDNLHELKHKAIIKAKSIKYNSNPKENIKQREEKINIIIKDYNKLINDKKNESPKRICKCFYCNGDYLGINNEDK